MNGETPNRTFIYAANIPKYYLYSGLVEISLWVLAPMYVLYLQQRRGLSLTQVALVDALFWIAVALSEVPAGVIADRFSRRTSLIVGEFLCCIGLLLYGLAPTFALLILGNILWATAVAFRSGANEALLYESLRAFTGRQSTPRSLAVHGQSDAA